MSRSRKSFQQIYEEFWRKITNECKLERHTKQIEFWARVTKPNEKSQWKMKNRFRLQWIAHIEYLRFVSSMNCAIVFVPIGLQANSIQTTNDRRHFPHNESFWNSYVHPRDESIMNESSKILIIIVLTHACSFFLITHRLSRVFVWVAFDWRHDEQHELRAAAIGLCEYWRFICRRYSDVDNGRHKITQNPISRASKRTYPKVSAHLSNHKAETKFDSYTHFLLC